VYINVSHKGLHLSFVRQWLRRNQNWKAVYLVHDTIPLSYPEYVKPGDDEKHWRRLKNIAATASAIIVNTHFTGNSLRELMNDDISPDVPIEVAPLGVESAFRPTNAPLPHGATYFICVGTIEPRKNHLLLLQVWRRLVSDLGAAAPKLVIVGRRGWENENIIDLLERSNELRDFIYEYPRLPDNALANLMAGARAILFPSFVEGYGLPVVEALAQRVPVLCSDIPAHREIAGDVPDLLDPLDGPSWLDAVLDYSRVESRRRADQIQRMARFRAPSWDSHFDVFNRVLARIA
jgi:glycosyltransferase involved in cell wall biosynthesis